jgi:ligand-binding sensor domain-containing protein
MKCNLFTLSLLILIMTSCNKKYNIIGEDDPEPTVTLSNSCKLDEIDLNDYFNNYPSVNDYVFESNGTIWIASNRGLLKKENSTYTIYNTSNTILRDNSIMYVNIDHDNNIWIIEFFSLYKFDQKTDIWEFFSDENRTFKSTILSHIYVDDNNRIYVTDGDNLYQYNNGKWDIIINYPDLCGVYVYPRGSYRRVIAKSGNTIWIGTSDGLLKYINNDDWELYNTQNSEITDNQIGSLYIDQYGRKWLNTDSGVEMFDDINWYLFDDKTDVVVEGDLIIANHTEYPRAIYVYKNGQWIEYLALYEDAFTYFSKIRYDNEGYVWLSRGGSTIYKLVKNP